MYTFFSILAICATILVIFFRFPKDVHFNHHYHNYEHLDPHRFPDVEELKEDEEDKPKDHNEPTLDNALSQIQKAINKVNGAEGGYDGE